MASDLEFGKMEKVQHFATGENTEPPKAIIAKSEECSPQ